MAIYDDSRCGDLFDRYWAALKEEEEAHLNVAKYLQSQAPIPSVSTILAEQVNRAHERSTALLKELEQYRIP